MISINIEAFKLLRAAEVILSNSTRIGGLNYFPWEVLPLYSTITLYSKNLNISIDKPGIY